MQEVWNYLAVSSIAASVTVVVMKPGDTRQIRA
jgi:hypothetical protein